MALVTGTPVGTIEATEDIFIEGAPSIWFQDATANPFYNPDGDGFYWGLSGTATYNAFEVGCPTNLSLADNLTVNDVLCDNVGVKATIQQRNYIEFTFDLQSFFPFQTFRHVVRGGAVTETAPTQKFGFGPVNNNLYYMVYAPKVYDTDAADYIWMHWHRCQFVDPWTINMTFGTPWVATGIKLRAFVDTTKPSDQGFGMWGRLDPSAIT
ncbi:MAG: hypothetical protein ACXADW_21815 [Candidatus Hodarchaeales archaeon]|jgi:hypothetical protein